MSVPSMREYINQTATSKTRITDHTLVLNELKKILPVTYNSVFYKNTSALNKIVSIINNLMAKITSYNARSHLLRSEEISVIDWVKEVTLVLEEHHKTMQAYRATLRGAHHTRTSSIYITTYLTV